MQDFIFWLIVLGFFVWLGLRRRQRRDQAAAERTTPEQLQGYRAVDWASTPADLRAAASDGAWSLLSLEDLPTQHRRRLVMQVQVIPGSGLPAVEALLWTLAARLQRWASAHVVVVEAFFPTSSPSPVPRLAGTGVLRLLLAIDGAGWSGQQAALACVEGPAVTPRLLGLAEVQRQLRQPPAPPSTLAATLDDGALPG